MNEIIRINAEQTQIIFYPNGDLRAILEKDGIEWKLLGKPSLIAEAILEYANRSLEDE